MKYILGILIALFLLSFAWNLFMGAIKLALLLGFVALVLALINKLMGSSDKHGPSS